MLKAEVPEEARQELNTYLAELETQLQAVRIASTDGKVQAIITSLELLGAKATEAIAFMRGLRATP